SPGKLEFKAGTNCTGGFTSTATVTINSAGNFSGTFTAPATAGTYSYRAAYQGASQGPGGSATNWQQSTSACQTIQVAATVAITITTSPAGKQIVVDGTTYTAPQTFNWAPGDTHTLDVLSPQSGGTGTQFVWTN